MACALGAYGGSGALRRSAGSSMRAWRLALRSRKLHGATTSTPINSSRGVGHFGVEPQDNDPKELAPMLPLMIVADTTASGHGRPGQMEIVLTGGDRIIVWADVETAALARVLKVMAQP